MPKFALTVSFLEGKTLNSPLAFFKSCSVIVFGLANVELKTLLLGLVCFIKAFGGAFDG